MLHKIISMVSSTQMIVLTQGERWEGQKERIRRWKKSNRKIGRERKREREREDIKKETKKNRNIQR